MGTSDKISKYFLTPEYGKIYSDTDKEHFHRQVWANIFKDEKDQDIHDENDSIV